MTQGAQSESCRLINGGFRAVVASTCKAAARRTRAGVGLRRALYSSRDHALIVDYVGADDLGHHREIEVTDFRHDYWTLLRMTREYS